MIIVVIYWKIKLGNEHRRAFLDHWEKTLTIPERSHLVGEFLSQPVSAENAGFPSGLLGLPSSSAYQSFFNVGIWSDMESFKQQVIDPHVGQTPKSEHFEYEFRERLVLAPVSCRIGQGTLPSSDHLTSQADI